ncbi:hypothetical protein BGZ63DRAFT_404170 [Mariannaea sp. PMI_226]|nr:hypothetical protein BGZ63DRAFT_404170 [Mariannaea sp. PMI_226]
MLAILAIQAALAVLVAMVVVVVVVVVKLEIYSASASARASALAPADAVMGACVVMATKGQVDLGLRSTLHSMRTEPVRAGGGWSRRIERAWYRNNLDYALKNL